MNNQKDKLVSIVIPTYNRKLLVERLILSIFKSKYKNIEIIVIDDASLDNTKDHLDKKFKNKKLNVFRNKKNMFAAGTRNVGLSKASGEYVFFVDDDNVLDKNTLSTLAETLDSNPKIGEVGPVIYNFRNKNKIQWIRARRNMWTSKTYHDNNLSLLKDKDLIDTIDIPNAYMLRRQLLVNNNIKFRKIFGIMYEESDIAYRIKKLGYQIVVDKRAKIYHDLEEDNFILDSRRPFVFARNRVIFHKLYSDNFLQFFLIAFFWSWIFAAYYITTIFMSKESAKISLLEKIKLSSNYIRGVIIGVYISMKGMK